MESLLISQRIKSIDRPKNKNKFHLKVGARIKIVYFDPLIAFKMKKSFKVFWISFAVYSILTFIGTLIVEQNENDLGFLINMKGYIPLMKFYTFLGLVFFATAFFSMWRSRVRNNKMITRLEDEKKELKAAMFDLKKEKESPLQIKEDSGLPEAEE